MRFRRVGLRTLIAAACVAILLAVSIEYGPRIWSWTGGALIEAVDDAYDDWRRRRDREARQEAEAYIAACYGLSETRMRDLRKAEAYRLAFHECYMVGEPWLGGGGTAVDTQDQIDACREREQAAIDRLALPANAISDMWALRFDVGIRRPAQECPALSD